MMKLHRKKGPAAQRKTEQTQAIQGKTLIMSSKRDKWESRCTGDGVIDLYRGKGVVSDDSRDNQ